MSLQKATINGQPCVVDSTAPTTPVSNVTGDGGDIVASAAALLANLNAARMTDPHSPAKIPGMMFWHEPRLGGLYQDSSATTPVSANDDPAGYMPDLSINGVNATQSTSGNRPLYKTSAINSLPGVSFDGSNDYYTLGNGSTVNLPSTRSITRFYVVRPSSVNFNFLGSKGSGPIYDFMNQGNRFQLLAYVWSAANSIAINTSYLICIQQDRITAYPSVSFYRSRIWVNGVLKLDEVNAAATWDASTAWYLGSHPGPGVYFSGLWALDLAYSRGLDDGERELINEYVRTWYGLTIEPTVGQPAYPPVNIVCAGDSITLGQTGDQAGWVAQLAHNFNKLAFPKVNIGVSGAKTSDIRASTSTLLRPGINILLVQVGTNDLATGVSAATTYSQLAAYCTARKAEGWKVIVATIQDRAQGFSGGADASSFETARGTVNGDIRTNIASIANGLADIGSTAGSITVNGQSIDVTNVGGATAAANSTYYADGIHPTGAACTIIANVFGNAILALLGW